MANWHGGTFHIGVSKWVLWHRQASAVASVIGSLFR
jgi:hypothetical protein